MLSHLQAGFQRFLRNPIGEVLAAALFLLAAVSGIFLGVGAILYLFHLSPNNNSHSPLAQLQIAQQLQGIHRTTTAFWLGIFLWIIAIFPSFQNLIFGIPFSWLLMQPLWCALLVSNRYDLSLSIALKTILHFTFDTPGAACRLYALGLLAFSGLFCFGIGIFITLPIAIEASLRQMELMHRELTAAIQRAYE